MPALLESCPDTTDRKSRGSPRGYRWGSCTSLWLHPALPLPRNRTMKEENKRNTLIAAAKVLVSGSLALTMAGCVVPDSRIGRFWEPLPPSASADWSFSVQKSDGKTCFHDVRYRWPWRVLEYKYAMSGGNKRFCGSGSGGSDTSRSRVPEEPLEIEWTNSAGVHIHKSIDMNAVLKGYDLYGGSLRVVMTETTVQVWLREPIKKMFNFNVYGYRQKEDKLIFESN